MVCGPSWSAEASERDRYRPILPYWRVLRGVSQSKGSAPQGEAGNGCQGLSGERVGGAGLQTRPVLDRGMYMYMYACEEWMNTNVLFICTCTCTCTVCIDFA